MGARYQIIYMDEFLRKRNKTYILMAVVIICSLLIYGFQRCMADNGSYAVVKVDGVEIERFSLSEDAEHDIQGYERGVNHLVIEGSSCYISEADCPDKLCQKQGKISRDGESIICLPHRVVITIEGGEKADNEVDAIAK